jgi:hypothetical protein
MSDPCFLAPEGTDPSTLLSLIFCNPLNIPVALFMNSNLKTFLSILSDVLSISRCSYHLLSGFFIPILLSGPFQHFILDVRPFRVLGAISPFSCL